MLSGFQLGTVAAYLVSPEILNLVSWPGLFLSFGSIGFFWLLFWLPLAQDNPNSSNGDLIVDVKEFPNVDIEQANQITNSVEARTTMETYSAQLISVPW